METKLFNNYYVKVCHNKSKWNLFMSCVLIINGGSWKPPLASGKFTSNYFLNVCIMIKHEKFIQILTCSTKGAIKTVLQISRTRKKIQKRLQI